jgi:hypothetical protein
LDAQRIESLKTVTVLVRQTQIGKLFPKGFRILLTDGANALDAIKAVDEEMKIRAFSFPVKGFESLLQMVFHQTENRFYKQVAIQASSESEKLLDVKENPKMILPDETLMILVPEGGCTTDWEEPVRQREK